MRMPAIFAAHGAPILLEDAAWVAELAAWAAALPRPESILMTSAHWEERPAMLGAVRTVPLVYDFSGFPEEYYRPDAGELVGRGAALAPLRDERVLVFGSGFLMHNTVRSQNGRSSSGDR